MAAEVKLDAIIEALELADDSISSYLDVETGEEHSITEEEVSCFGQVVSQVMRLRHLRAWYNGVMES